MDRLGRTLTQLINEQSTASLAATEQLLFQQLLECRAFRDALLTPTFEAKQMEPPRKVRIKLLAESVSISGAGFGDVDSESYASMTASCEGRILSLRSDDGQAQVKRFEMESADGARALEELDDRIQLARHLDRWLGHGRLHQGRGRVT